MSEEGETVESGNESPAEKMESKDEYWERKTKRFGELMEEIKRKKKESVRT